MQQGLRVRRGHPKFLLFALMAHRSQRSARHKHGAERHASTPNHLTSAHTSHVDGNHQRSFALVESELREAEKSGVAAGAATGAICELVRCDRMAATASPVLSALFASCVRSMESDESAWEVALVSSPVYGRPSQPTGRRKHNGTRRSTRREHTHETAVHFDPCVRCVCCVCVPLCVFSPALLSAPSRSLWLPLSSRDDSICLDRRRP